MTSSRRSMVTHICDVTEAINGRRPRQCANFASVGVDSLGAVLFVRSLSESLGGIKIDPTKIYSPDTTILGLAEDLYQQLSRDNPALLESLRITTIVDEDEAEGSEVSEKSAVEADLEEGFLSNRRLYEGMRGLLALMVLWDHYHPDKLPTVDAFQSDTFLFVILSGFTAAIQLRDPPKRSSKRSDSIVELRGTFDWKAYLMGRAVGIFPILWAALIISTPRWIIVDTMLVRGGVFSYEQSLQCIPLYISGIQSLFRPQCKHLGPNTTVYASLIWTVFILYGIMRSVLVRFQNLVMRWASADAEKKGLRCYIGNCMMMVAFNRPCVTVAVAVTLFWALVLTVSFTLLWRFMGWKTCFMYISYFVGGVVGASIVESIHWASWNRHLSFLRWTPKDLFPSIHLSAPHGLMPDDVEEGSLSHAKSKTSILRRLANVVWRFLPDAIFGISLMFLFVDFKWSHQRARVITWIVMPLLVIIFLVVATLQRGAAKLNLTRLIFETSFLNFIGNLSYPLCKSTV